MKKDNNSNSYNMKRKNSVEAILSETSVQDVYTFEDNKTEAVSYGIAPAIENDNLVFKETPDEEKLTDEDIINTQQYIGNEFYYLQEFSNNVMENMIITADNIVDGECEFTDNKSDLHSVIDKTKTMTREYISNLIYEIEICQVVGLLGCLMIIIGLFCPVFSINFNELQENVWFSATQIILIFLLTISTLVLMLSNKHKYCVVPTSLILAEDMSIFIGFLDVSVYIQFKSGYYWVLLGTIVVLLSVFLINTGYAKDSGLRHNKPIYLSDIIWICFVIVCSMAFATFMSGGEDITSHVEKINELKEDGTYLEITYY